MKRFSQDQNPDQNFPYVQSEAQALLDVLNMPYLLETMTEKEIKTMLRKSHYIEEDPGEVTLSWGRKADRNGSATVAFFRSADGKFMRLAIGSGGAYSLTQSASDSEKPDPEKISHLLMEMQLEQPSVSPKFADYLRRHLSPKSIEMAQAHFRIDMDSILKKIGAQNENE